MGKAKYHFAYDESNGIVDIKTVSERDRKHHKYHCISCGAEMIAKLGNKKIHHFAHKSGDDSCNIETYLHKLGKYLFKKKFEKSSKFLIKYLRTSKCSLYNTCDFCKEYECIHRIDAPIDLKKFFDTCTEEQTIDGFRADLLLSDSSERYKDKVLLEIRVTHECTEEKKLSGYRIIEILIKSEEDLLSLLDSTIEENDNNKFFGFKREVKNKAPQYLRTLPRFFLYPNNKAYVDYHSNCVYEIRNPKTIFELMINEEVYQYWKDGCLTEDEVYAANDVDAYKVGLVYALNMGINIKNCSLCKYCRTSPLFCCMSKKYGTPRKPQQEYAAECQYYSPYQTISEIKKVISNIPIVKIDNVNKSGTLRMFSSSAYGNQM